MVVGEGAAGIDEKVGELAEGEAEGTESLSVAAFDSPWLDKVRLEQDSKAFGMPQLH